MKHTQSLPELFGDFEGVYRWFKSLGTISIGNSHDTIHIIVDMINGFVKEGALASKEVLSINAYVADFTGKCKDAQIPTVALADMHTENSVEFDTYPVHCLKDSEESRLTDEIAQADETIRIFGKNSTNGFLEKEFADMLVTSGRTNFIITGDCTDMCVIQLALTLKADFNRRNIKSRVIVPYELTATCSLPEHNPELAEIMALYIMKMNGIEVVKNINL